MKGTVYMGLLSVLIMLMMPICVVADDDIADKQAYIETLQSEIAKIDSEILRCKKMKTSWTVATVVGGAGTVATGTAAIIQGVKLSKLKKAKKSKEEK